jgi:hypothetical protein
MLAVRATTAHVQQQQQLQPKPQVLVRAAAGRQLADAMRVTHATTVHVLQQQQQQQQLLCSWGDDMVI